MQDITLPAITPKKISPTEGQFIVEPLYPGYGTTVGTALRRVLLSSLLGAAVTSVKVAGADHEFSTIPGVKEDAIEILLNLKMLRFTLDGDEPVTVSLTKSGAGKVTGKDITATDRLKIVSKDQHIATLADKKSSIDIELTVEKGRGYLPVERREEQKLPVGTIAVDAIFTPVKRVNFTVEHTRVGQMTNFDRLTLDIETDQTVSPDDSLKEAARILVSQFELFIDPDAHPKSSADVTPKTPDIPVEDAELSARTTNALLNNNLKTMQAVAKVPPAELAEMKGFGKKAVDETLAKLKELSLQPTTEPEEK